MLQGLGERRGSTLPRAWLASSPLAILGGVCAGLAFLLALRLSLPAGPFYWDLVLYLDAANRILDGQVPSADFFAPAGPLGYWLFTLFAGLFPNGQPLLVAGWSLLLVTAPLMALVLADVGERSRPVAFALLVPFLVFAILPFNVETYSSYPGVDGFGIYNRQISQIAYVLAAGLVFVRSQRRLMIVAAAAMTALFLVKITGFLAGLVLCGFAFAAGRLAWRAAGGAALAFFATLAGLEAGLGVVSAYLGNIVSLMTMNEESILPRFLQAGSIHFGVIAPLAALILVLAVLEAVAARPGWRSDRLQPLRTTGSGLDRDALWLAVVFFAALFAETQNTGGQGFIFVWPVLLRILIHNGGRRRTASLVVLCLVAAGAFPTFMQVVQRAGRTVGGQVRYEVLAHANLKGLGAVTQRREILARADRMIGVYRQYPEVYRRIADLGELPSLTLSADTDFQVTWLKTVDEAVGAIKSYETANGVHFATIMNLGFVNPFPWLLDRHAPRFIAIGAVPGRAVPAPGPAVLSAVAGADLVLSSRCPITKSDRELLALYRPGLAGHRRITLSPCWDAFVRTEFAPKG